ncbi:Holliday junction branch migration protein RuvA [Mycetocola tolaasinivorans]|uniref:Holliday junction branch migration complex subunit RuvA n=1 Tax=Mycetocola tolaasinivorans TaxID=76635 RepID=A0A3L6ZWL2_9MICO|nr:Holliday junction branch migration protein RuvA [Mycetocola tolaasinivorans]RLP72287.1 Holliday junction branch migration protein RuvA [Mycetocola tolaasinivorans]
MIVSLRGTVLSTTAGRVAIEVNGVGYAVQVTPEHGIKLRVGANAFVHTAHIIREDSQQLFGFESAEQLEVFEILLAVNGVGPKSALGVLAALSPDQIADAVAAEDDSAFRKVSGIGPKTAKLMIVSLAGKLQATRPVSATATGSSAVKASVIEALLGLGWNERVAVPAVEAALAAEADPGAATVPGLLRVALASLGPQPGAGR